jgi:glycosyltransferase involved in cell wall biosynthesis
MALKILFLTHVFHPGIGGIEVNAEILAHAFTEAGHEVRLVTWTAAESEQSFPYTVVRRPSRWRLIQEHQWTDVVFENNPCLRLAWPNLLVTRPNVVALNTWVARVDGTIGWLDRLKFAWFRRASGVIAVSEALRRACWPEAVVIHNPYRPSVFQRLPEVPRTVAFVFLGRLVSDKGVDLAIRALHRLNTLPAPPTTAPHLTIIGSGPERERLEALVDNLGLGSQVEFVGALQGEALSRCLNRHRFLLVPSVWEEPFGNVALEGMACGCVPVVSDGGGLPEAVGKSGLTFKRGDMNDLALRLQQVLSQPYLEQSLQAAAAAHLRHHRPEVVAERYLTVIQNAFNQAQ